MNPRCDPLMTSAVTFLLWHAVKSTSAMYHKPSGKQNRVTQGLVKMVLTHVLFTEGLIIALLSLGLPQAPRLVQVLPSWSDR